MPKLWRRAVDEGCLMGGPKVTKILGQIVVTSYFSHFSRFLAVFALSAFYRGHSSFAAVGCKEKSFFTEPPRRQGRMDHFVFIVLVVVLVVVLEIKPQRGILAA